MSYPKFYKDHRIDYRWEVCGDGKERRVYQISWERENGFWDHLGTALTLKDAKEMISDDVETMRRRNIR